MKSYSNEIKTLTSFIYVAKFAILFGFSSTVYKIFDGIVLKLNDCNAFAICNSSKNSIYALPGTLINNYRATVTTPRQK